MTQGDLTFNRNLAAVLAFTVMYESGQEYPREWCGNVVNGDPPAPAPTESTRDMLNALSEGLPRLLNTVSTNTLPYERANLRASQETSPAYAQLQADIYSQFGPQLNSIGQDIARSNALSQSETDRQVVGSDSAKELVRGTEALQREVDPEFYKNREVTSDKYQDLLGGMDPNKLSGAELANVERANNRSNIGRGIADSGSNIGAVSNALQFDNRLQQKRSALSDALANFGQIQGGSRSGVDAFQLTTGKPSNTSFGQNNLLGANQNVQGNVSGQANNLLGQVGENTRTGMNINANRRDAFDRVNEGLNSTLGNL